MSNYFGGTNLLNLRNYSTTMLHNRFIIVQCPGSNTIRVKLLLLRSKRQINELTYGINYLITDAMDEHYLPKMMIEVFLSSEYL